jgi:predicted phosphodiesterase
MFTHHELFDNENFIKDLYDYNLSGREVANKWGVGKTFVNKHRSQTRNAAQNEPHAPHWNPIQNAKSSTNTSNSLKQSQQTITASTDGSRTIEAVRDRPVTLQDAREWILASGDDPEEYDISIRSIAYGVDMFSNRMSATPKRGKNNEIKITQDDYDNASSFINNFTYIPAKKDFLVDSSIIVATDDQIGKTDFNGGSDSTIERVLNSYAEATEYLKEYRPRQTLIAHAGDPVENVCNTSSQRDTNDLDLPHQILAAYKVDLAGIKMLAPLTGELKSAYVPSNHGRFRAAMKQDSGNSHADFGITNAKQIAHTLEVFGGYDNVEILWPEALMESMTVYLDTVNVGITHGHQAGGPDKVGDWWAKQDHGRMPTWDADVLIAGHWHSYRAYQSGDKRWVFIGPANEPGSSWYTNLKGESSTSGMLAMSFVGKKWKFQEIL